MKGKINNQFGDIHIAGDVISTIAGSAAVECFGIVGMAAVGLKDGFVRLLKRESLQKGIEVSISDDNAVTLKMHIIVAYGVSIYAVSENLIETVRYKIEESTGLKVESIQVYVESVRPID
jgi:uncharacterized alkaline shock family protein YloU